MIILQPKIRTFLLSLCPSNAADRPKCFGSPHFNMAYFRRRAAYSRRRYTRRSTFRGTGTRFVATKYSRAIPGREVPYYLAPGVEAHVFDTAINHLSTGSTPNTSTSDSTLLNPITRGTGLVTYHRVTKLLV